MGLLRVLTVAVVTLVLAGLIIPVVLWGYDIWQDRRHVISVLDETPVYAGEGNESCDGTKLATLQQGTKLHVRRIRYWKNCATLDIRLSDGKDGFIIYGDGHIAITPPLN